MPAKPLKNSFQFASPKTLNSAQKQQIITNLKNIPRLKKLSSPQFDSFVDKIFHAIGFYFAYSAWVNNRNTWLRYKKHCVQYLKHDRRSRKIAYDKIVRRGRKFDLGKTVLMRDISIALKDANIRPANWKSTNLSGRVKMSTLYQVFVLVSQCCKFCVNDLRPIARHSQRLKTNIFIVRKYDPQPPIHEDP